MQGKFQYAVFKKSDDGTFWVLGEHRSGFGRLSPWKVRSTRLPELRVVSVEYGEQLIGGNQPNAKDRTPVAISAIKSPKKPQVNDTERVVILDKPQVVAKPFEFSEDPAVTRALEKYTATQQSAETVSGNPFQLTPNTQKKKRGRKKKVLDSEAHS